MKKELLNAKNYAVEYIPLEGGRYVLRAINVHTGKRIFERLFESYTTPVKGLAIMKKELKGRYD